MEKKPQVMMKRSDLLQTRRELETDWYQVSVDGNPVDVYGCGTAAYRSISVDGKERVQVRVRPLKSWKEVKIRPLRYQKEIKKQGETIEFELGKDENISIEFDDDIKMPLFLFASDYRATSVGRNYNNCYHFHSGLSYEVGELFLEDGDLVIIEEGACVYGRMIAHQKEKIVIAGGGVLSGKHLPRVKGNAVYMLEFVECKDILVSDITVVEGPSWHVVPIACEKVRFENLHVISEVGCGDGIDLVGCSHVLLKNCFVRANDDCIAIKANGYLSEAGCKNIEDILIEKGVFWNWEWGNALEIGYETRADYIRDITFRDCDVIRSEFEGYQSGGTFTIHNGDRAEISNIRYEDIRIEDSREKLIDIKILSSKYSKDKIRGSIHDIYFKDISIVDGAFPPSIIRGFETEDDVVTIVERVTIENLTYMGNNVTNQLDARMIAEISNDLIFIGKVPEEI